MNISPIPSPPIPILLKVLAVGVLVTIAILAVHGVVFVLSWVWELSPDSVDLLAYDYNQYSKKNGNWKCKKLLVGLILIYVTTYPTLKKETVHSARKSSLVETNSHACVPLGLHS